MTLVTSVTYNYKVNGFTISTIKPQRGLRQGNPLSPFLFILVADVLSLMINKAVDLEELDGFKLAGEALLSPILCLLMMRCYLQKPHPEMFLT